MAILGQILNSYGRPQQPFGQGIHMARAPGIPEMQPDPGANMYRGGGGGGAGDAPQQGQSVDEVISGFKDRLAQMRGPQGQGQGPVMGGAPVAPPVAPPAGGAPGAGGMGGMLNSIMRLFGGGGGAGAAGAGAAGGMDPASLMAMIGGLI